MSEHRGVDLIAAERQRQIEAEGWTPEHDDGHMNASLAIAAACYAAPWPIFREQRQARAVVFVDPWPWDDHSDARKKDERGYAANHPHNFPLDFEKPARRIDRLVKAGALIAAEIDRIQRREASRV